MRSHGHWIYVGLVGLLPGRSLRNCDSPCLHARDAVEELTRPEFFADAPFDEINVLIECGERTRLTPRYRRIRTKDGLRELPITIELAMDWLERREPDKVEAVFRQVLLDALLAIAAKYKLAGQRLEEARERAPTLVRDSPEPPPVAAVTEPQPDDLPKLYKNTPEGLLYWETWEVAEIIIIHKGVVGQRGTTKRLPNDAPSRNYVAAEARQRLDEGYAVVGSEDHATVIVQYRTDGWGSEADLRKREAVQESLDSALGWTGLGHCEGGDIGSGTMNIFCEVVDADVAVPEIVRTLEKGKHLEGAVVAVKANGSAEVRWPADHHGSFSY